MADESRKALAIFGGEGKHWAARWLKRGFEHVGCAVPVGEYWVVIDPGMGTPRFFVPAGVTHDLAAHYRRFGYIVVEVDRQEHEPRLPLMPGNCVGMVKKILGISAPFVVTPYQLYRRLTGSHAA